MVRYQAIKLSAMLRVLTIVDGLAAREWVFEIAQQLAGGGPNVDFAAADAERMDERPGIRLGLFGRGEPRQGVGEHVLARQSEPIHRPRRDN